ncbi:hypothetical protein ACFQYP_22005 [Nonomuraea antimicrobica]
MLILSWDSDGRYALHTYDLDTRTARQLTPVAGQSPENLTTGEEHVAWWVIDGDRAAVWAAPWLAARPGR